MDVAIMIPARLAATRFPKKALALIDDKPMIQWVYEACIRSKAQRVIVATDHQDIVSAVQAFGGEVALTSRDHQNGTQRIAEVAKTIAADIVVNVQGDEPLIDPRAINQVIEPMLADRDLKMATLAEVIEHKDDVFDPSIVKVTRDAHNHALYFSRAPIPFIKTKDMHRIDWSTELPLNHLKHVGIYAYRRDFLFEYCQQPPCALELMEGLEQLRALHMGVKIHVALTKYPSIGVDVPDDLTKVKQFLEKKGSEHA